MWNLIARPLDPAGVYLAAPNRDLEYFLGLFSVAWSIPMLLKWSYLYDFMPLELVTQPESSVVLLVTGVIHLIALRVDGRAGWTFWCRFVSCAVGAALYALLTTSLLRISPNGTSIMAYLSFTVAYLYQMVRVAKEIARIRLDEGDG